MYRNHNRVERKEHVLEENTDDHLPVVVANRLPVVVENHEAVFKQGRWQNGDVKTTRLHPRKDRKYSKYSK